MHAYVSGRVSWIVLELAAILQSLTPDYCDYKYVLVYLA